MGVNAEQHEGKQPVDVKVSIVRSIMDCMPRHANGHLVLSQDGYKLSVNWKLNNDPSRPNKPSKTIVVNIPHELIEGFPAYSPSIQRDALKRIRTYI